MLTRNLDKARQAFRVRSEGESRKAHDGAGSAEERHRQEQGKYIKSFIYGGLDGIVTTFAVVAGVAGAALSPAIVLILGFANLFADGLSMAIGDFLSTKAENEYNRTERLREEWEVAHYPEGEIREMVELYVEKGLARNDAETITGILSKNRDAWISVMMVEELGIVESGEPPLRNALVTFSSFTLFGFIPLVAYVVSRVFSTFSSTTFLTACILTGLTLFTLGAVKVKITGQGWFRSGIEILFVGGIAASAAYGIGKLVSLFA